MIKNVEALRNTILQFNPAISDEGWSYFVSGFVYQVLSPRDFFIEAGKKNIYLGFVTSGLIRGYYLTNKGEEITTTFSKENDWVTDYPSLLNCNSSRYYFQALEPTNMIAIPFTHIKTGYERFPGFERNGRLIAEAVLQSQQRRIESFRFDSAEQRYVDFVNENPGLFNRISLTHLSSFLGIKRPSLSRIRRKIAGR